MDDSLKTKVIEQAGRRFDIHVFRYDGELLEAVPFENGVTATLPYPDGVMASPLYQLSMPAGAPATDALMESLIETAEADIRRRVF